MTINKMGVWGEIYAGRYLRDNGYKIVTANFRRRVGEIDIVAQKDDIVCIIEVKTRKENSWLEPRDAVDYFKQNKIKLTADLLPKFITHECNLRFDIIEVVLNDSFEVISLRHLKDAF